MLRWLLFLFLCLPIVCVANEDDPIALRPAHFNSKDYASLQNGAKLYMNYCSGCHSMQFIRYNQLASGVGIVDKNGKILESIVQENLIFNNSKIYEPIRSAMTATEGKRWFGVAPPDLTLAARVRGANWLFTYLTSFYQDNSRPWGANNLLFPDVAMPNILLPLQGTQIPIYLETIDGNGKKSKIIGHLKNLQNGQMSTPEFEQSINDIVNFLVYVAEPIKAKRLHIGGWVIAFLLIFLVFCYILKREYWKDIY